MKLALGTVQFGLPYGVANMSGQVDRQKASEILRLARAAGLDTLDTAIAYGNSEQRLGEVGVSDWKVISKLPALPPAMDAVADWVDTQITQSLERLRISKLDALMLHRPSELLGPQGGEYRRALQLARELGRVRSIGYSIYSPGELESLCDFMKPDIIQAPFNIIDRRLLTSGWLDRLADMGVRVHVRSVFLQGLLLMSASARPEFFLRWQELLNRWSQASDSPAGRVSLALNYALSFPQIEKVVVGVETVEQLREILSASTNSAHTTYPDVQSEDLELIEPSRWKIK